MWLITYQDYSHSVSGQGLEYWGVWGHLPSLFCCYSVTTQMVIVAEPEASECGSYDPVFTGPASCGTTLAVPFSIWVSSLGGGGCVHTRGSFPSRPTYLLRLQAPDPCMRPEEPESGGEALEFAFRDAAKWWRRAGMSEGQLLSSLPRMPSFQPQLSVSLFSIPHGYLLVLPPMQLFCGAFCTEWAVFTLLFIPVHFLLAKTSSIFVLHLLPSSLLEFFELQDHFLLVLLLSGASHNAWQWVVPTKRLHRGMEGWGELLLPWVTHTHTDRDLLSCWSCASGFYLKDKVST